MSNPASPTPRSTSRGRLNPASLRQRPSGWPVGSFRSYELAQQAVDKLSDEEFPVQDLTIVGVNLMEVERVTGRLTWGRVLFSGAASGAWLGVFFGLLLGIFSQASFLPVLGLGVVMGAIFGAALTAVPYALSSGQRDFTSATQIVAGRYDVLCNPQTAPRARDAIARMGIASDGADMSNRRPPRREESEIDSSAPAAPKGLHYGQVDQSEGEPPQPR